MWCTVLHLGRRQVLFKLCDVQLAKAATERAYSVPPGSHAQRSGPLSISRGRHSHTEEADAAGVAGAALLDIGVPPAARRQAAQLAYAPPPRPPSPSGPGWEEGAPIRNCYAPPGMLGGDGGPAYINLDPSMMPRFLKSLLAPAPAPETDVVDPALAPPLQESAPSGPPPPWPSPRPPPRRPPSPSPVPVVLLPPFLTPPPASPNPPLPPPPANTKVSAGSSSSTRAIVGGVLGGIAAAAGNPALSCRTPCSTTIGCEHAQP